MGQRLKSHVCFEEMEEKEKNSSSFTNLSPINWFKKQKKLYYFIYLLFCHIHIKCLFSY